MGRFIVLGSAQMVRQVAESLAGRVGILELALLTWRETAPVGEVGQEPDYRSLWLSGGFPDAYTAPARGGHFRDWWESYLRTWIERDLSMLGVAAEPLLMRRLLTMLAHAQSGLANYNQLATALGVANRDGAALCGHSGAELSIAPPAAVFPQYRQAPRACPQLSQQTVAAR